MRFNSIFASYRIEHAWRASSVYAQNPMDLVQLFFGLGDTFFSNQDANPHVQLSLGIDCSGDCTLLAVRRVGERGFRLGIAAHDIVTFRPDKIEIGNPALIENPLIRSSFDLLCTHVSPNRSCYGAKY